MDCHIAFAPEIQVSSGDFVAAWNDSAECRDLAEARIVHHQPQGFPLDPELTRQGLVLLGIVSTFLGGVVGAVLKDELKDLLKAKVKEILKRMRAKEPAVDVKFVRQPDGAYLIVVTKEGE
ncbi:MAG: hypothetical protein AB1646_08610 [Thermodesulfobacteriota bacterium]